jgi:hypothetical protein
VSDAVELAPQAFAALVAPAVDRVLLGAMRAARDSHAEVVQRYGGPTATGCLVEFRTRLAAPGGTVSTSGFAAVTRYRDPVECRRLLDKQIAHGMLHRTEHGFRATDRGRAFLAEVHDLHATVTADLWADHTDRVLTLVDLLGRAVSAALELTPDGPDGAFLTLAPPHEPDASPPGVLLLDRLDTLRHHRADAHAAAWQAAGHTAQSITRLTTGPERQAIEQQTNRLAALPFTPLSPTDRLTLLSHLAALPT